MDEKICLDTDVCIDILKGNERAKKIFEVASENKVHISVITVFELLLRKTNIEIVERFINSINKLPIDDDVARTASKLQKDLLDKNIKIDIRNLFIAACAINNDCELVTFNKKDFLNIGGLDLYEFQ